MALLADTGLVAPDLAELLAGDAETGQRPRQVSFSEDDCTS
nr:hypothetical protein [Pseudomonas aeruginosa]